MIDLELEPKSLDHHRQRLGNWALFGIAVILKGWLPPGMGPLFSPMSSSVRSWWAKSRPPPFGVSSDRDCGSTTTHYSHFTNRWSKLAYTWAIYLLRESTLIFWLVVGPPLWKILVNWAEDIPNIWENKIDGNQTTDQLRSRIYIDFTSQFFFPKNSPPSANCKRLDDHPPTGVQRWNGWGFWDHHLRLAPLDPRDPLDPLDFGVEPGFCGELQVTFFFFGVLHVLFKLESSWLSWNILNDHQ